LPYERFTLSCLSFSLSNRCRSCAKFGRKLDQLALQYEQSGDGTHLKIGTVEYMQGRQICQALEIEAIPTVHLYYRHEGGVMEKVKDFSCPPSAFSQVQEFVRYYVDDAKHRHSVQEQRLAQVLDQGQAMIQTSLEETKKLGKLRSGWRRLLGRRGNDT
jgi:thioredoxin-like negative regulator of GroEL